MLPPSHTVCPIQLLETKDEPKKRIKEMINITLPNINRGESYNPK
jgi:hypothetical protein